MREVLYRIGAYALKYKWMAAANIAAALLALCFSFVFPQIIQYVIDDILAKKDPSLLSRAVLVLLATYALRELFNSLRTRVNASFEQRIVFDLRRDLYAHTQRLPLPFLDAHPSGDWISRLMEDVVIVERVIIEGGGIGVTSALSLLIVSAILLEKNLLLAAVALAPLPFFVAGAMVYSPRAYGLYRFVRQASATINAVVADNLQGIRQVKAFGQEEREQRRFSVYADALRAHTLAVMNLWSVYGPSMDFVGALGTVGVFWIGGPLVASGKITLGELIAVIFYLPLIYEPTKEMNRLNQMIQSARASCERIYEIMDMDEERSARFSGDLDIKTPIQGEVAFDHVSFQYGNGRAVLNDVCLVAAPGQVIALVGPTGCGKTTLVNLLLGFYQPLAGRILIDGQDIANLRIDSLRSAIAIVTQEAFLFNGTIFENVAFARDGASRDEVIAACRLANCHDFIMSFPDGYESRVGERGVRLSVGEKQRIGIARALLKDAPILILDEATASVDALTESQIQEALEHLVARRTTFIIAHRMNAIRHASEIVVMQHGRIIAQGAHDELIDSNRLYRTIYRTQTSALRKDAAEDALAFGLEPE